MYFGWVLKRFTIKRCGFRETYTVPCDFSWPIYGHSGFMCCTLVVYNFIVVVAMDKTIVQAHIRNEDEFVRKYGVDEFPSCEEAWSIIRGKDGGRQMHEDCLAGFQEFLWIPKIKEHVCFFCLGVDDMVVEENEFDEAHDWLLQPLKSVRVPVDEQKPETDLETDSQNQTRIK